MRLIDAKELDFCNIVKAVMSPMGCAMLKHIDNDDIPTAYDVEKVIQQLEDNLTEMIKCIHKQSAYFKHVSQEDAKSIAELFESYTKAQIEVVKRGGID